MNSNTSIKCPACGETNRVDATFCQKCRSQLRPQMPQPPLPHVPPQTTQPSPASAPPPMMTNPAPSAPVVTPPRPAPLGQPVQTTPLQPAAAPTTQALGLQPRQPIKSAAEDLTQTLPSIQTGFSVLPPGALLEQIPQMRYVVVTGQVEQQDVRHVYRAEQWTSLDSPQPMQRFLIVEVADKMLVDRERELVNLKLPDAGLLLPVAYFSEQLWESTLRHYLVYTEQPAVSMQPASRLQRPQLLESVLGWGIILAGGLQTLHAKLLAHTQVSPQSILVNGNDARLTDFENVKTLRQMQKDQQSTLQRQDVALLATSLLDLLGGLKAVVPAEVIAVLQRGQGKTSGQPFTSAQAFGQALQQTLDGLKPGDLKVRVGHSTDVGMVRDHNEDNEIATEKGLLSGKIPLTYGLYIVADGMGGHAAGEDASDLAIESAQRTLSEGAHKLDKPDSRQMQTVVRDACLAANQAVFDERTRRGSDMGTTIVAALRIGDRVAVGNIGDSRAYLINAREIKPITVDHSLVQRLIETGQITAAEARSHPQRNLIYKVVGDKPNIEPDVFSVRLQQGDRMLMCSDGLWEMVEDPLIWRTVLAYQDPQLACEQLIALANKAGGEDNITAIIVQA